MDDMYTRIGQLFTPQTYKAEHTDTRQAIRRHDPEHQRRRNKGEREGRPSEFDMEDHADVSVSALKSFLQDFLKSMEKQSNAPQTQVSEETAAEGQSDTAQAEPASVQRPIQTSPHAARAASAYQTTARKTGGQHSVQGGADKAESLGLASADIRVIHDLIQELGRLELSGVHNLRIERGTSFLDSLTNAVRGAAH